MKELSSVSTFIYPFIGLVRRGKENKVFIVSFALKVKVRFHPHMAGR